MHNAMWLASIFGPFMAIIGLWMLLYSDNLVKVYSAIKSSPSVLYFSAILNLFLGLIVLNQYDMWSMDGYVLVTLLGWVMIIRGVMGLFVPQLLIQLILSNTGFLKVYGIIPLVWGLALSWLAFFM